MGNQPRWTRRCCWCSSSMLQKQEKATTPRMMLAYSFGTKSEATSGHEEQRPALLAEVVFALDDQRVENSDGQKRGKADDESDVVYNRKGSSP